MGRVLRFDRARRLLGRVDRPGLADVAATCGYYDQAHLTREWNELAGCTPTTWMSEELPSVQDSLVETGAC
jgi:AraC-like DNA-binding protein